MKTQFSLSDRFCRMACSIILLTKRQSIHCMIVITLNKLLCSTTLEHLQSVMNN